MVWHGRQGGSGLVVKWHVGLGRHGTARRDEARSGRRGAARLGWARYGRRGSGDMDRKGKVRQATETEDVMRETVLVEIRAGEGGEDARLLVGEQTGIYARYGVRHGL